MLFDLSPFGLRPKGSFCVGFYIKCQNKVSFSNNKQKPPMVTTFTFTVFIYAIIFNSLNTRSTGFNVFEHIGENKKFSIVMISIAIVQTLIIQFGGKVFSTVPMDLKHYGLALAIAALIISNSFYQ